MFASWYEIEEQSMKDTADKMNETKSNLKLDFVAAASMIRSFPLIEFSCKLQINEIQCSVHYVEFFAN